MKKTYMKPLITVEQIKMETYLQVPSVSKVTGTAGVTKGDDDNVPIDVDAKDRGYGSDAGYGDLW